MKVSSVVKVGGFALLGIWLLNAIGLGAVASTLNVYIKGFGFGNGGVSVQLAVQNPRSTGFTINSIVGNVFANGNQIANLSSFYPVLVAPNSESIVPVTLRTGVLDIFSNLRDIIDGELNLGARIDIVGTINVNDTAIPLNIQYQRA